VKEVEAIAGHFHGATFNSCEDLTERKISVLNGEEVRFGNDFLFCDRNYSREKFEAIVKEICEQFGVEMPEIKQNVYTRNGKEEWGNPWIEGMSIYEKVDDERTLEDVVRNTMSDHSFWKGEETEEKSNIIPFPTPIDPKLQKVTFKFTYTAKEIPPRCRKARSVVREGEYSVLIPKLTVEDAPVAVIERSFRDERDRNRTVVEGKEKIPVERHLRLWEDRLWYTAKFDNSWNEDEPTTQIQEVFEKTDAHYQSWEIKTEYFDKWASRHIIVDGVTYIPVSGEPRLCVEVWSKRPGLCVEIYVRRHFEYGGNKRKDSFFRMDQMQQVRDRLAEDAERFQFLNYEVITSCDYDYEILLPEAVKLDPLADHAKDQEEYYLKKEDDLRSKAGYLFSNNDTQAIRALSQILTELQERQAKKLEV
jgi:hypothetical protein